MVLDTVKSSGINVFLLQQMDFSFATFLFFLLIIARISRLMFCKDVTCIILGTFFHPRILELYLSIDAKRKRIFIFNLFLFYL